MTLPAASTVFSEGPQFGGEIVEIEHVACNGRDAAVAAGRELLKKHAEMFNEQTSVEARLVPEIEWRAEGE